MEGVSQEKYHEHQPEAKLADGSPIYHAFLGDALVVSPRDREMARDRVSHIETLDPTVAERCSGKSLEEARVILEAVEAQQKAA